MKGFTLIELLIVIAILGVLAAGILVAIDPLDKINSANDAKVQNDVSQIGRASEAYAVMHNGFYLPVLADLDDAGELKKVPTAPSGYKAYDVWTTQSCLNDYVNDNKLTCTKVVAAGELKSKKYTSNSYTVWKYESSTGKSCAATGIGTPPGLPGSDCP